jgi:hypothetical protein
MTSLLQLCVSDDQTKHDAWLASIEGYIPLSQAPEQRLACVTFHPLSLLCKLLVRTETELPLALQPFHRMYRCEKLHSVEEHTLLVVESIVVSIIMVIEAGTPVELDIGNLPFVNAPKRQ